MCVSELSCQCVTLVEQPLLVKSESLGSANIVSEVTRVLFLPLYFKDIISQQLNFSPEFRIHE